MRRTRRPSRAYSAKFYLATFCTCAAMLGLSLFAHSAIVSKADSSNLFTALLRPDKPEHSQSYGAKAVSARDARPTMPASEILSGNAESLLYSPTPVPPPPAGDLDFSNPGGLQAGAACSTATSCTIVGGIYTAGVFDIPAGVTVQVTGNVPLQVSATTVTIAGTLDASAGVAGGGAGGNLPGVDGGGGAMPDGTIVPNGGHAAPTGNWGNLGGGGGGGNGGGGGSGGSNGNDSGAGGNGIGANVAGGAAVTTALTQGNPGQGGAGGGGGSGGTDTQYGQKAGGDGGGGVTGTQGDPQLTTFAAGGGGGHGGIDGAGTYGGQGGPGGGAVKIVATSSISMSGTLAANGGNSNCVSNSGYGGCGGGGAGGTIWLSAPSVTNTGTVSAVGGSTDNNVGGWGRGGGGGAGRIRVDNSTGVTPTGNFIPAIGYTGTLPNAVPFVNAPLVPSRIAPGSGNTTVTIHGAGFVSSSVARVNGANRTTTFVNGGEIQIEILALDLVSTQTLTIDVVTGVPGGGTSNPAYVYVTNPLAQAHFAAPALTTVGKGPRAILLTDLDGDGILDLVVNAHFSSQITVLHGNGNGSFTLGQTLSGGLGLGIAAADFNRDGILDLAYAATGSSQSLFIALGQGNGTFGAPASFPIPMDFPEGLVAADFNKDGNVDVMLVGRNTNNLALLLGDGTGAFGAASSFSPGNAPLGLVTGDFNGDGNLDLAVAASGQVAVSLGTGTGSFGPITLYGTGGNAAALVTADLNGDGILDLVVHNDFPNNAVVLLGAGDGTFVGNGTVALRAAGNYPNEIAVGNIDGDGKLDLVGASRSDNYISIALGDGTGSFAAPSTINGITNASVVALGDINGDGRMDIIATNDYDFSADGTISILRNNLPPVANAGADQLVQAGAAFTLSGAGSYDPDVGDSIASYEWRLGTNVVGNTATLQQTATGAGVYTYTLTVADTSGLTSSDTVDVTVQDTTPPTITVVRPNGGEKLFTNSPYYITWTASDNGAIDHFDVLYSTNGGGQYFAMPGCSGVSGTQRSCVWYAPGPATSSGRVRVVAVDTAGNSAFDASNANFSIVSGSGSITVTAPNTAVDWGIGSTQKIMWNHNLGLTSYVRIEVSRDGRETWQLVADNVKNTTATAGTYNWVVTASMSPAARIRVTGVDIPVGDISNVYFTISEAYIGVAAPATTVMDFGYGTLRTQTWTTNLGPLDKVNVYLSTDGGATCGTQIGTNVIATNKALTYTVPTLGLATTAARVCVQWTGGAVQGLSPVNFRVGPAYIQVTYPNLAADAVLGGSTQTITWANNLGNSENVKIELSTDGGNSYGTVLLASTPSDGVQAIVIPGPAAANCKIRITWLKNPTLYDDSSQSFPIN